MKAGDERGEGFIRVALPKKELGSGGTNIPLNRKVRCNCGATNFSRKYCWLCSAPLDPTQKTLGGFVMALRKTDVWINRSRSGKGFTVRVDGVLYVGAISTLQRFIDGAIKGMSLSMVIPDSDDDAPIS